jgi:hypothetical protein
MLSKVKVPGSAVRTAFPAASIDTQVIDAEGAGPGQGLALLFQALIANRRQARRNRPALLPADSRVFALGTAMTGKDHSMEWKQIETKWAAMTRRIRADYVSDRIQPDSGSARSVHGRRALTATITESLTATAKGPEIKTTAK